jgi:hypothetical protein
VLKKRDGVAVTSKMIYQMMEEEGV